MSSQKSQGFGQDYWDRLYHTPGHVDGCGNAAEHAAYLRALFYLEMAHVDSIADFGFGLGRMLVAMTHAFKPSRVLGIEPSTVAFAQFDANELHVGQHQLRNTDLLSWCQQSPDAFTFFDLGICSSVLQYLSDDELSDVIPVLAHRLKWLYLTVPTTDEYTKMDQQSGFHDPYAIARSVDHYRQLLAPHFEFVSSRLLESRRLGGLQASPFTEAVFRH